MNSTPLTPLPMISATTSSTAVLYLAFSRLLDFPNPEVCEALGNGSVLHELQALHAAVKVPIPADWTTTASDELEQQYIATFDVGTPESPVPLYETAYDSPDGEDRRAILEELVRFYEYFDLDLGERPVEQPDHITVELEFMAALAQMELSTNEQQVSAQAFQLAQRDFLVRHLIPFVKAIRCRPIPSGIYTALFDSLSKLLQAEQQRLEACCNAETVHGMRQGNTHRIETLIR